MGMILGMLPHPWGLSAGTASLLFGKRLLTQVYTDKLNNVKNSPETATCTCICFRWPQNNSATYKSLMSNISQIMGNWFDFKDIVSQKNQGNHAVKKSQTRRKHKPQVGIVSKVKIGRSFWAWVRMRDVFRVDERCEKKQTKTLKKSIRTLGCVIHKIKQKQLPTKKPKTTREKTPSLHEKPTNQPKTQWEKKNQQKQQQQQQPPKQQQNQHKNKPQQNTQTKLKQKS